MSKLISFFITEDVIALLSLQKSKHCRFSFSFISDYPREANIGSWRRTASSHTKKTFNSRLRHPNLPNQSPATIPTGRVSSQLFSQSFWTDSLFIPFKTTKLCFIVMVKVYVILSAWMMIGLWLEIIDWTCRLGIPKHPRRRTWKVLMEDGLDYSICLQIFRAKTFMSVEINTKVWNNNEPYLVKNQPNRCSYKNQEASSRLHPYPPYYFFRIPIVIFLITQFNQPYHLLHIIQLPLTSRGKLFHLICSQLRVLQNLFYHQFVPTAPSNSSKFLHHWAKLFPFYKTLASVLLHSTRTYCGKKLCY